MSARAVLLVGWVALSSCRGAGAPSGEGSASTGRIEGAVLLSGDEVRVPTRVENTTDPVVCGRAHTLEDLVLSSDGRGVRHAILSLVDVPESVIPPVEPERLVLHNTNCRFLPHAAVLTTGSTLEAINSDAALHTTHLYGPSEVNISLPQKGARSERRLDRPGIYTVRCDVHGWMQATIRVDSHPFHAVTNERGAFRIEGVPEGRYTLEVWHEKLGTLSRQIDVRAGTTTTVEVEFVTEGRQSS